MEANESFLRAKESMRTMPDRNLALAEPLLHEVLACSTLLSRKVATLLSMLVGLGIGVLLSPARTQWFSQTEQGAPQASLLEWMQPAKIWRSMHPLRAWQFMQRAARSPRDPQPVLIVTGNSRKIERLRDALGAVGGATVESVDLQTTEIQASTVREVAEDKARKAFSALRRPLVVHDVGLMVDALAGFPGPYTAYAAKTLGLKGLLGALDACGRSSRSCSWQECLAFVDSRGEIRVFEATEPGTVALDIPDPSAGGSKTRRLVGTFGAAFVPSRLPKALAAMDDTEWETYYENRNSSFKLFAEWWKVSGHMAS